MLSKLRKSTLVWLAAATAALGLGVQQATTTSARVRVPSVWLTSWPTDPTQDTSATFRWSTTGSISSMRCVIDGGSATSCSSPTTYSGLTPGGHSFKVTVSNRAGSDVSTYDWTQNPTDPPPPPTPDPTPATPTWNGDFSTGDWGQYDDCRSHHTDGVYPTYYTISRADASRPFGGFSCSSTGALPNQETGPTPPGFAYAGKYTVDNNSTTGAAGQRTLDTLWPQDTPSTGKSRAYQGVTSWYRDEQYFPSDFQPIANSDWNWTYEIHNWPDNFGDANLSCGIDTSNSTSPGPFTDGGGSGERLSCRVLGGGSPSNPIDGKNASGGRLYGSGNWYTNPDVRWTDPIGVRQIQRGHWYDLVFKIKWSWQSDAGGCTDPASQGGCFEWWVDGTKVASWSGPTLLYYADNNTNVSGATPGAGQGYMDHGYYRSTSGTWRASVYHGATMIGGSAADIGETLP